MDEDEGVPEVTEDDEAYPWLPSHVVADSLFLAANIARAAADHLELMAARAGYDHNHQINQRDFAVQAAKELEKIIDTTEE